MKTYTKESLIFELLKIRNMEWIENRRHGNDGGIGNTLEDLLDIEENNLPIPNAAEWELKTQRTTTSSLNTIFHMEPSPRAYKFVPQIFLLNYGWLHDEAGHKYPENEMSFRQTIRGGKITDRGFGFEIDRFHRKVIVTFDASKVDDRHSEWLKCVEQKIGLGPLNPAPYWGFDDLGHKAGTKLTNCFFVKVEVQKIKGKQHFWYKTVMMLTNFSVEKFIDALSNDNIYIDFDARTGHNHGTKFRLKQNVLPLLYDDVQVIAE
ncbi:hypothetical protein NKDENANG_03664 [Candidatus Entotheonellaceae bacterium PAL068K]